MFFKNIALLLSIPLLLSSKLSFAAPIDEAPIPEIIDGVGLANYTVYTYAPAENCTGKGKAYYEVIPDVCMATNKIRYSAKAFIIGEVGNADANLYIYTDSNCTGYNRKTEMLKKNTGKCIKAPYDPNYNQATFVSFKIVQKLL